MLSEERYKEAEVNSDNVKHPSQTYVNLQEILVYRWYSLSSSSF